MSEPYIRMYAADMRADPKVIGLPAAMRYALLQAYDIAKNGPGACDELRSSDGRAMRERELRTLSSVSANETRAMFERWRSVGLCEIEDGLVTFPNLAKRQGIDRSAAERMRRYRQRKRYGKRDADVTEARYGDVTGQNQNQNIDKPSTVSRAAGTNPRALGTNPRAVGTNPRATAPTPPDVTAVWSAYTAHHPAAQLTPQRRELIKRRLRSYDPTTLVAAVDGNHRDPYCNGENQSGKTYHSLELILRDADHIEKYAALAPQNGNGHITTEEEMADIRRRAIAAGYKPGTDAEVERFRKRAEGEA